MNYSKGISWFNDCRIPFVDGGWGKRHNKEYPEWKGGKNFTHGEQHLEQNDNGRFPANLLCSDDVLNDGNMGGSSYCPPTKYQYEPDNEKFNSGSIRTKTGYGDKGSNSRYYDIDKWFNNLLENNIY